MTSIKIVKDDQNIKSINIKDHAGFANHGQDIVCAGISSIIFGSLNALDHYGYDTKDAHIDEASIAIDDISDDSNIQVVLETMIIQLKTIQESYPDYLNIDYI
jgi:uncharacterized protein